MLITWEWVMERGDAKERLGRRDSKKEREREADTVKFA
jgi:hypothetical protein